MCGIFGVVSNEAIDSGALKFLANHARQRGRDSSGVVLEKEGRYFIKRADADIKQLLKGLSYRSSRLVLGHSRLITNGSADNQPVIKGDLFLLHNGIVVNDGEIWKDIPLMREAQIDSEAILALAIEYLESGQDLENLPKAILSRCEGVVACAIGIPKLGKLVIFSNNGSLYYGKSEHQSAFSSEEYPLKKLGYKDIVQVKEDGLIIDLPSSSNKIVVEDIRSREVNMVPDFKFNTQEEGLLQYPQLSLRRCTRCILPETMPFISFDVQGVCNYCRAYKPRNVPKPKDEIFNLLEPYRRKEGAECIVPFSGGRDSCYGLHLIVNELKMKPITYTYDWGMVTDLGRRNISRMCSRLGVENIIIADDIEKKRRNIARNLKAWLKSPHLGMISILTAGDKHFFRHIETVKKQTGISLNLWGVNPLEITHFKAGFLGVPPAFEEKTVYMNGWRKQLRYQALRFRAMLGSPGYFNLSLWDTLSGEYYRSFTKKKDYYHIFDYWRWEESIIDSTLIDEYDWETAIDTNTTWRIGDGTAAFYNYIYYLVAGFTEHDTFRSNQIREGDITREEALRLVADENRPRYENIRWYLDVLGMDFSEVISVVNKIPRIYKE